MNSFKSLHDALAYEIVRQVEELESGGRIVQETRHWDAGAKRTSALRCKEEAHDYRYFPEPDMVPFEFADEFVECIAAKLPELPDAKKRALHRRVRSARQGRGRCSRPMWSWRASSTQAVEIAGAERAKAIGNWMLGEMAAYLNAESIGVAESTYRTGDARRARRAHRRRHHLEQAGQGGLCRDGRDR